MPTKDNASFTDHIKRLRQVIARFPVAPKEVIEDEKQRKVMVHAVGRPEFYDHVKDETWDEEHPWENEYVFIITMNETGDRIEDVVEFLDSKATEIGRALVARALENLRKFEEERA